MIEIDGSVGEGGGQILRSSVALATITGTPIVITNIRANRKKPGLKRQHLAAINAAAEICDARTSGLELHSTTITFEPHCIRSGEYSFSIGTAGSTSLVLQTVLIPLLLGDGPSTVRLEGGTHNEWAPPFDFLEHCYVPMLVKMGADVAVRLERFGFYPAGCGRMVANIKPVDEWRSLELLDRGQLVNRQVRAISAKLPASVADRELKRIRSKTNWPKAEFVADADVRSTGPGNVVLIQLDYECVSAVFTGFGKIGRRAEAVADGALHEAVTFIDGNAPLNEYLADQLLLPMAVAAASNGRHSRFVTAMLSSHAKTHVDVIQRFLNVSVDVVPSPNRFEISVSA